MKNLLFVFLLFIASCAQMDERGQKTRQWMIPNGKLKVLSTTSMVNDLVHKIGGEVIDTITLIQGNSDPHSYQLVKGDDEKLGRADLIFYNGLSLEHGASLQHYLETNDKAIALGNLIQKQDPKKILYVNGQVDPHIWMDLALFAEAIPFIVEQLSLKQPAQKAFFQANGETLNQRLMDVHQQVKQDLQKIPSEKRYLVTSHDAFNYFAKAYLAEPKELEHDSWHLRFQAPEGLAPDSQLGSADIQLIINHLNKFKIHVIFPESNVSQDSIRKIIQAAKENGLDVTIAQDPLYGDAMGAPSYPEMLLHNAHVISKYLGEL